MKYCFIVAAAGIGRRMGLDYPKQFLEYKGEPIFLKVIKKIQESPLVTDIIIATNSEYIDTVEMLCKDKNISKLKKVVAGGNERQDSVYNALCHIEDIENTIVGVQDGVRPFIRESYIEEAYEELVDNEKISGVVIGVVVKDTIKILDEDGCVLETPNRAKLIAAQTPQVFRGADIMEAYKKANLENFYGTDSSSLLEKMGKKVKVIEGSYGNIKITTSEDLIYLEGEMV